MALTRIGPSPLLVIPNHAVIVQIHLDGYLVARGLAPFSALNKFYIYFFIIKKIDQGYSGMLKSCLKFGNHRK